MHRSPYPEELVGCECGAWDTLPPLPGPEELQGPVGQRDPAVVRNVLTAVVLTIGQGGV